MSAQAFAQCPILIKDVSRGMMSLDAKDSEKLRYQVRKLMIKKGYTLVDSVTGLENASTLDYTLKMGVPCGTPNSDGSVMMGSRYEYHYEGLDQIVKRNHDDQTDVGHNKVKSFVNGKLLERRTYKNFFNELKALPNCPSELAAETDAPQTSEKAGPSEQ